jgi:RNA polymerase sigma factor (sigma-70 family)
MYVQMSDLDWSSARFREALAAMARKRVPPHEVEDIVQSTLTEALASPYRPEDPSAARKWIWGIARNKVVDYHRRSKREHLSSFGADEGYGGLPAEIEARAHGLNAPSVDGERDLLRWATRALPQGNDAQETLLWLLREGEGEKLEDIAESAKVPAPRVRKRVSRLRAHLRAHWAKEVAAMAALGILLGLAFFLLRAPPREPIANEPVAPPKLAPEREAIHRAEQLRQQAAERCARRDWNECIRSLDDARGLDPAGDTSDAVLQLRAQALDAVRAPVVPSKQPEAPAPTQTQMQMQKSRAPSKAMSKPPSPSMPVAPSPKGAQFSPAPSDPFLQDSSKQPAREPAAPSKEAPSKPTNAAPAGKKKG